MCGGSGSDWAVKSGHLKGTMQPRQLEHFWNAEPGKKREEEKMKFQAIPTVEAAMKAVESDGYALQYVLSLELFKKIALHLAIKIED